MKTKLLYIRAYAKINLLLDVICRRPDGYHELEGIMQEISLYDELLLSPAEGIEVICDTELPFNNTCRRAAEAFLGKSGRGVKILLNKRIPSEAGLGGASADAAAVLRGLNEIYRGTPLERSEDELFALGLSVGADVPFCLLGGCAEARGVGEELKPTDGLELPLLIVRGPRGVSTGKLFSSLGIGSERASRLHGGALENALEAIKNCDPRALAAELENALQPAAEALAPEIGEYCERMKKAGALGACMTGSGAAVFGIFESTAAAEAALPAFSDCEFAAVCSAFTQGSGAHGGAIRFDGAERDDAPVISALRRQIWADVYRGIYPDEAIDDYDFSYHEARDRARIDDPYGRVFVLRDGETPVGYMYFLDRGGVHIGSLYMLKEYRGKGIGRAAFALVAEYCREKGYKTFTFNCNAHNYPALAFYERIGGREIGSDVGHENRQEDQLKFEFEV